MERATSPAALSGLSPSIVQKMQSAVPQQLLSRSAEPPRRSAVLRGLLLAPLLLQAPVQAAEPPAGVLVVGASGGTGSRVVRLLLSRGVRVRAGVRDESKPAALALQQAGAILVHADVTEGVDALEAAIGDADSVVCCTGFSPSFNFGVDSPQRVDGEGTRALVDASVRRHVRRFVLVTSLLTNAPAVGQRENPNYKFLNALGGVLDYKREAELYLQASPLAYTILRPGGLSNEPPSVTGGLVIAKEDTFFGLPTDAGREISRDSVADVAIAALFDARAERRVLELVASPSLPPLAQDAFFL